MKKRIWMLCALVLSSGCSVTDEVVTPSSSGESTPVVEPSPSMDGTDAINAFVYGCNG